MSRQQYDSSSPESASPNNSDSRRSSAGNTTDQSRDPAHGPTPVSEGHSPSPQSPQGVSSSSEGYPSWLPKRPPGPAPRSTIQSSVAGMFSEPGPSHEPMMIGRKPTPRSVRIVSLQSQADKETRREPTDQSRAFSGAGHARAWSRATSAALTPTLFSASGGGAEGQLPRPRFKSPALHVELLRSPSWKMRLWYCLFPIFVFAHIPLQTFFDFNAVFILLSVAKHPNPEAPGVPGSGRNWALAAAAYIACWFAWIGVVFVVYELVYSFIRRWRVKRPLILPIYFSSSAFNFAAMSSYANFCFMYHIRSSAFRREHGSILDGLAETFYFYSQNLPTVALLMPRAALCMALLFSFSSPDPAVVALADAGISARDGTFFRSSDGTLTDYARGVLIANAAWTAWRMLLLLVSWLSLWILSGQGCAGLCGPRYRWEEEDAEKAAAALNDNISDFDALPWSWKECTILRIKDAYDFCLTNKPPRGEAAPAKEGKGQAQQEPAVPYEGIERIFAAVGLHSSPPQARRGILSEELFESPRHTPEIEEVGKAKLAPEVSDLAPPAAALQQREKQGADPSGPLMKLPYPFTGYGAQVSSEDVVPFPPSPAIEEKEVPIEGEGTHHTGDEEEEEEGEEGEEEGEEEEEEGEESEVPSSERRTSGSMSSLGRPIVSRYPFQFRHPRGSMSSASHMSPPVHSTPSRSTQSRSTRHSRSTQSTGNAESTDSHSPRSNTSSNVSPMHSSFSGSVMPMPPRHPQAQQAQRRARAGTVPAAVTSSPSSPSPVAFPGGRPRARTRTESMATDQSASFGPIPIGSFESDDEEYHEHDESLMSVPEAEGSIEEAEREDSVGLLSAGPSPRTSLANLRNRASARRSNGSRSHSGASRSNSRSRTNSGTSISDVARSRAQSLIQSLGAASRSSIDLVRSRTNSLVRLADSPYASTSSEVVASSPENHTFGHPLREQWRAEEGMHEMSDIAESVVNAPVAIEEEREGQEGEGPESSEQQVHSARSSLSRAFSVQTERGGVPIAGRETQGLTVPVESLPDVSTAPQSFVTAPTTREDTTSSSGQTRRTWGTMEHYTGGTDMRPM